MTKDSIRSWKQGDTPKQKRATIHALAGELQQQGRNSLAVDLLLALESLDLLKGKLYRWAETTLKGAGASAVGSTGGGGINDVPKETRCALAIQDVAEQLQRVLSENDDV